MSDWCQKRITSIELKARFADGKHRFYLESVCAAPVRQGKLCDSCKLLQVQTKTQDVRTFPHGFVLDEYPPESHIFDSTWYHSKVEAYGRPSDTDIVLAMEAQKRAYTGKTTRAMKDLIDILITGGKSDVQDSVETIPLVSHAPATAPSTPKPNPNPRPRPRTRGKSKTSSDSSSNTSIASVMSILQTDKVCKLFPTRIQFVESTDDPIDVELITVHLKPFIFKDIVYWRNTETEYVYTKDAEGKRGTCVGKWNVSQLCILEE